MLTNFINFITKVEINEVKSRFTTLQGVLWLPSWVPINEKYWTWKYMYAIYYLSGCFFANPSFNQDLVTFWILNLNEKSFESKYKMFISHCLARFLWISNISACLWPMENFRLCKCLPIYLSNLITVTFNSKANNYRCYTFILSKRHTFVELTKKKIRCLSFD